MQKRVILKNAAFFNIAAQMVQHGGSDLREDKHSSTNSGFDGVIMRYNAMKRSEIAKTVYAAPQINQSQLEENTLMRSNTLV